MEKSVSKIIFSLVMFSLVLFTFVPYFRTEFKILKEQKEIEENYQKLLEIRQKSYLTGKFNPEENENFILISPQYILGEKNKNKMYLRKETYGAYLQMYKSASRDGVELKIASATRNFEYQKDFWNNKWFGVTLTKGQNLLKDIADEQERFKKILEYTAAPGTSRHHWGTDIDINNANPAYFNSEKGKREYNWLVQNAHQFGFCQTYNQKNADRVTGYNEEKWHWSYIPLARIFLQEYKNLIKDGDINGFLGDEYAPGLNLINDYALSINPECM